MFYILAKPTHIAAFQNFNGETFPTFFMNSLYSDANAIYKDCITYAGLI